jgi:hypothetical protein
MEGFTKREVKEVQKAREAQAMLRHPTDRDFLGMVCGGIISNCPVTANAVKNTHQIFGPDLAGIRGSRHRLRADIPGHPRATLASHVGGGCHVCQRSTISS